jgi:hypothetical protein
MDKIQASFLGKWESLDLESRPNAWGGKNYLKRFFHNTEKEAIGTLVFYTDDAGDQLNLTLSVIGPYHFGDASRDVPGALEADFDFTRFIVTPHSEPMVEMLNKSRPPASKLKEWKSNQSQTIDASIEEGFFGLVIGKYKEYDLVKVEEGLLYYGGRPADGSAPDSPEKRAKGLQVPLKRVNEFSIKI